MMFTDNKLHNLMLLLLGIFIIIAATKRLGMMEEILTLAGLVIGIKLVFGSLKGLDVIK
jgi:hypothetical protein